MADQTITIDLSAPARLADVPTLARQFLGWWAGELLEITPASAKKFFPKRRQSALLYARGDNWRIIAGSGEGQSVELDAAASDTEIADQILRTAPDFGLSRLTLVLPRRDVLLRRIELPLMPEASVRSAIELQIDRLSPFKAETVRFAVRVAERDPIEGKLFADIVIVPRTTVEPLEARLAKLGFRPIAVDIETANGGPAGFDLRDPKRAAAGRRTTLINVGFAAGAVLMWALASYAWSAAREGEISSWHTRVAELQPVAQRSAMLRRQLEAMTQPFEIARTHQPALSLDLLTELTKLVPDDARLTELRITGDVIELTGLAADAPGLIAKLEGSKRFAHVKFRSPVMRRPNTTQDRFEISMKLEGARGS